jgi:hypothetical protein
VLPQQAPSAEQSELLAAVQQAWPAGDALSRARRAAAEHLLSRPTLDSLLAPFLVDAVAAALGGGQLLERSVEDALKGALEADNAFTVKRTNKQPRRDKVVLHVPTLLQRARQAAGSSAGAAAAAAAPSSSTAAAQARDTTGGGGGGGGSRAGGVTVDELQRHVDGRVWHESDQHLDEARRALARHLVELANPGLGSEPANTDARDYNVLSSAAGVRAKGRCIVSPGAMLAARALALSCAVLCCAVLCCAVLCLPSAHAHAIKQCLCCCRVCR